MGKVIKRWRGEERKKEKGMTMSYIRASTPHESWKHVLQT